MNKKICDKCLEHKKMMWDIQTHGEYNLNTRVLMWECRSGSKCCSMCISNNEDELQYRLRNRYKPYYFFKRILVKLKFIPSSFDLLELNDTKCHYYAEHQFYNWNKKYVWQYVKSAFKKARNFCNGRINRIESKE